MEQNFFLSFFTRQMKKKVLTNFSKFFVLSIIIIFYWNRKRFVVEPLARFIGHLFAAEQNNTENHGTESPKAE